GPLICIYRHDSLPIGCKANNVAKGHHHQTLLHVVEIRFLCGRPDRLQKQGYCTELGWEDARLSMALHCQGRLQFVQILLTGRHVIEMQGQLGQRKSVCDRAITDSSEKLLTEGVV